MTCTDTHHDTDEDDVVEGFECMKSRSNYKKVLQIRYKEQSTDTKKGSFLSSCLVNCFSTLISRIVTELSLAYSLPAEMTIHHDVSLIHIENKNSLSIH